LLGKNNTHIKVMRTDYRSTKINKINNNLTKINQLRITQNVEQPSENNLFCNITNRFLYCIE